MQARLTDKDSARRKIPRVPQWPLAKSLTLYRETFEDAKSGVMAAYATKDYVPPLSQTLRGS